MHQLRRYRFVLGCFAIIALSYGMIAGALVRAHSVAPNSVTDSVLGQLVLCHQGDTSDAGTPAGPAQSGSQHTCPACIASAACAVLPAVPSIVFALLSDTRFERTHIVATPDVGNVRAGSLGSRAPPFSA